MWRVSLKRPKPEQPPRPEKSQPVRGQNLLHQLNAIVTRLQTARSKAIALENARLMAVQATNEAKYRALLEASGDGIFLETLEGEILECNQPACGLYGYTQEELVGLTVADIVPEEIAAQLPALIETEIAQGEVRLEALGKRKDGSIFPVEVSTRLVTLGGEPRVVVFVRDIQARQQAENELRALKEFNEEIVQRLTDGVLIIDPEGLMIFTNPAAEQLLGYSREELTGTHWSLFVPDEQASVLEELRRGREAGEEGGRYELEVVVKDGGRLTVLVSAKGHQNNTLVVFTDITERKRALLALEESQARYASLFEGVPVGLYRTKAQGEILQVNQALVNMLGYPDLERLMQANVHDIYVNPEAREEQHALLAQGVVQDFELELYHYEGGAIWVRDLCRAVVDEQGQVKFYEGSLVDITQQKKAEGALQERERTYRTLVNNLNVGVYRNTPEPQGRFLSVNPAIVRIFGYESEEEFLQVPVSRHYPNPEERKLFLHEIQRAGQVRDKVLRLRRKDGTLFWASITATAHTNEQGEIDWFDGMIEDVTERKNFEEQLLHDALHDALTGLPNRALLIDRLNQTIKRVWRNPKDRFGVLFMDLDRFKVINDSLGHSIGDKLLVMLGQRLSQCLRAADTVARLGGDEFVVLLDRVEDERQAVLVAERIQEMLRTPFQLGGREVFTTGSIGIVIGESGYDTPDHVLRDADIAMYHAKTRGRDRYVIFTNTMREFAYDRMALESELRPALELGQLEVHYQPIVALKDNRITGFEALMRWRHPTRGLLLPLEFLPIAEETGMMVTLSNWLQEVVCCQLRAWQDQFPSDPPLSISINLSGQEFVSAKLVDDIRRVLKKYRLEPTSLQLEITEEIIMESEEIARQRLEELRELGVGVQMDDFGTGYSSLHKLASLPINTLKVDRLFVRQIGRENADKVVKTIVRLAHDIQMQTVGEGIEEAHQLSGLEAMACDYGQGFIFSKALTSQEATALLSRDSRVLAPHKEWREIKSGD
jgi:diguanylate cyclase (GGDEF)-like protein/PAS domain S-box-containing protein